MSRATKIAVLVEALAAVTTLFAGCSLGLLAGCSASETSMPNTASNGGSSSAGTSGSGGSGGATGGSGGATGGSGGATGGSGGATGGSGGATGGSGGATGGSGGATSCGHVGENCCAGDSCTEKDLSCLSGVCACPNTCSADFTQAIDCHGQVTDTCSGDTQCMNGTCLDPCAQAAFKKTSVGCDFWALKTDNNASPVACFAAYVANTWNTPVKVTVTRNGQTFKTSAFARIPSGQGSALTYQPYDDNVGIPPGEVAILFLSGHKGGGQFCPVAAAVPEDPSFDGTGRGHAFHVTTTRPVAAYQILPYGGGAAAVTSATLLLPTNVWDQKYVAINAYKKSAITSFDSPSLDILAHQDGTNVTITPKVPINAGNGVAAGAQGQPVTYTLNAGEYLQITQPNELTGSSVTADKPIGMWGASRCFNVPNTQKYCDTAQQQIPPIGALGNRYVGVRYRGRNGQTNEAPPWRLVGVKDGTQLTWTPSAPPGAPTSLSAGQVAEFNSAGPFIVSSQDLDHPFYAAGYMTGGSAFAGQGDSEWVNVIPPDQFLDHYVLFTDPTYPETELVVVRTPDNNGNFQDVNLDCLGKISGWQKVGVFEYARVDLVTGNFKDVGSCSNGRHEMSSKQPFGVTVWGWGSKATGNSPFSQHVSYAYPAGASVRRIAGVY